MTTFDWPKNKAWQPSGGAFFLQDIGHMSASPFTGASKALSLTQIWRANLTWNNHALIDGVDIQGFIEGLEGFANPVRMFDFWRIDPQLLAAGYSIFTDGTKFTDGTGFNSQAFNLVVVNSAAKGAAYVTLSGLPVSQPCFKRGDLIGLGGYLYQVRIAANSDGAGQATLWIQPGLRIAVAAGDMCNISYPTVPMRLAAGFSGIDRNFNWTNGFTLSFVEDVP